VTGPVRGFVALFAVLVVAGCGRGPGAGALDDTLAYFPEDAGLVVVVTTDLGSDQLERFDRKVVEPQTAGRSVEDILRQGAASLDLSFEEDVEPLLGNPLVIGMQGEHQIAAALRVRDATKLREVVEDIHGITEDGEAGGAQLYRAEQGIALAIEGDFLLIAQDRDTLVAALEQRDSDGRLTQERFEEELPDTSPDSLLRGYADVATLADFFGLDLNRPEIVRLRSIPWFGALRTVGVTASFSNDDQLVLDVAVNTDAGTLSEDNLPLATGEESPGVVQRTGEIASANRDQSRTTVFLLRAANAVFPDSRFVRAVEELEDETGIDFENEILRQFDGPSASSLAFDGQDFAARSEVRDPDRLREQLRVLAPRLPELVQGLEGLRSEGLALLLLLAPDAIASTQPLDEVRVELPQGPDDLYHVSGLTGEGPSDVYFGLVGDVFVIGSDEERARAIADEPAQPVAEARGAAVARFDVREGTGVLLDRLGFGTEVEVGEVVGSVEASTDRLRTTLRVELP
jgi:hypothetical protein